MNKKPNYIARYARKLYPAFKLYVQRAEALHPGAHHYGLCTFISSTNDFHQRKPLLEKLLSFYVDEVPNATPACVEPPRSKCQTPFNCVCGRCGSSTYITEGLQVGSGLARINNPYRRAFINWVCRLAGKPELLPSGAVQP